MKSEVQQPPAAAEYWAAAAAAREWLSSIRLHAAGVLSSAAWSAVAEADEAVMRAAEDGGHVVDEHGWMDAGAMERAGAELKRASSAMVRAAKSFRRSSRLDRAAALEQMRASRASRRAADAEYAGIMRDRAKKSRGRARDAARHAASADKRAGSLLRDAGRVAACASAAAAEGVQVGTGRRRELSLARSDMWEDAKRRRLDSAALAGNAAEVERLMAGIRRVAASAANLEADVAVKAAERGGGTGDPGAERAAAAWRRAMAAANRADAESPAAANKNNDGGSV